MRERRERDEREEVRERARERERERARETKTIGDWREESALVGTQKAMDDESRESVFVMNGR